MSPPEAYRHRCPRESRPCRPDWRRSRPASCRRGCHRQKTLPLHHSPGSSHREGSCPVRAIKWEEKRQAQENKVSGICKTRGEWMPEQARNHTTCLKRLDLLVLAKYIPESGARETFGV